MRADEVIGKSDLNIPVSLVMEAGLKAFFRLTLISLTSLLLSGSQNWWGRAGDTIGTITHLTDRWEEL